MDLKGSIRSAELRLLKKLEDFFVSVYDDEAIPSHGLEHHRRVWRYVVELALEAEKHNRLNDSDLSQSLIIASFLHDIGMSVEPGEKHGRHSMEICRRFLRENHMDENDFPGMLQAIMNHDNKDYLNFSDQLDILTILSIADDLDAFGFTGIYRYLEIYLLRGIDISEIGSAIRKNALSRYNHFAKAFAFSECLINRHKKRYNILDSFFIEYGKEAPSYISGSKAPKGYCGIAESVKKAIIEKNLTGVSKNSNNDPVFKWFIEGLASEVNSNKLFLKNE
jgi:HD superfamily phosphodiesterase